VPGLLLSSPVLAFLQQLNDIEVRTWQPASMTQQDDITLVVIGFCPNAVVTRQDVQGVHP
jgi:hypothetical protein